jgi:hypothetical protein
MKEKAIDTLISRNWFNTVVETHFRKALYMTNTGCIIEIILKLN